MFLFDYRVKFLSFFGMYILYLVWIKVNKILLSLMMANQSRIGEKSEKNWLALHISIRIKLGISLQEMLFSPINLKGKKTYCFLFSPTKVDLDSICMLPAFNLSIDTAITYEFVTIQYNNMQNRNAKGI